MPGLSTPRRTRRITALILIATSAGVLLGGCGPDKATSTAPGAGPVTATQVTAAPANQSGGGNGVVACGLITDQDASTAIGSTVGPGTSGGTAALSECIYGQGALIVGMKTDGKALYDKARTTALAKGATDVPGVGDSAFVVNFGKSAMFYFVKGTTFVNLMLARDSGSATDAVTIVAKAAAAKV